MLAQLVARGGISLGEDLIGANVSNPFGHYEDRPFVRINQAILEANGHSWHTIQPDVLHVPRHLRKRLHDYIGSRCSETPTWAVKDPRLCLTIGEWERLIPDMHRVIVYRHYAECVDSLERRHARDLRRRSGPAGTHQLFFSNPDHALAMWVLSNEALLNSNLAGVPVVSSQDLLDGFPVGALFEHLEIPFEWSGRAPTSPNAMTPLQRRIGVSDLRLVRRAGELMDALEEARGEFMRTLTVPGGVPVWE